MTSTKKEIFLFIGIFILFLGLRVPAIHLPYHQDEYKWPIIVNPELREPGGIPHPPVGEFIYRELAKVVGYDNFRAIPFIFATANIFLLFYLVRSVFDKKAALWSIFIFSISFYSVLASLTVDTDGAILPFFFLLSLIFYFKFRDEHKNLWLIPFGISIILGFLTKTSFIIPIGAFVLDFLWQKRIFEDKKRFFKYLLSLLGLLALLIFALFVSKLIIPSFNLSSSVKYWEHFAKFSGRGWLQTFIQLAKAILYTSPLLVAPLFLVRREIWHKSRIFYLFIALGLIFYILLFDFSTGALDRYLEFLVLPLSIISGAVLSKVFSTENLGVQKKDYLLVAITALGIFSMQFFSQAVPPLYPKTDWINRILHFDWQFLFPFTGGSGPTGFYVSFSFMALIWIVSLLLSLSSIKMEGAMKRAALGVLVLGLIYNAIFVEEYIWGRINGSPHGLLNKAESIISSDKNIKKVVVYNDIGGYDIQKTGKYERRLYAAPQFEETYKEFFKNFSGHILYINIPRIGQGNFYSDYFSKCRVVYRDGDKYIDSYIFDCRK